MKGHGILFVPMGGMNKGMKLKLFAEALVIVLVQYSYHCYILHWYVIESIVVDYGRGILQFYL